MSLFSFGKKAQLLVTATVAGIDERWTFKLKEDRVVIGRKEGYNPKVVEFLGTWDLIASPLYWPYRTAEFIRWQILRTKSKFVKPGF